MARSDEFAGKAPGRVQYSIRAVGSRRATDASGDARIRAVCSFGNTHFTDPNVVGWRVRVFSSISDGLPGYQLARTPLDFGVKRWVISSTVRPTG